MNTLKLPVETSGDVCVCVCVYVVMVVFSGPRRVIALRTGPITEQTSKRELVLGSLHPSININLFSGGVRWAKGEEKRDMESKSTNTL